MSPAPSLPFSQFATTYLRDVQREATASTYRTRRSLVLGKLVPYFGCRPLAAITQHDVLFLLDAQPTVSSATRNRMLSALSSMFRHAMDRGLIARNPVDGVRRLREHVTALPLLHVDGQEQLIAAIPAEMRALFIALLDTGARLGEMLRLQWRDVESQGRSLLLRTTKAGRPRIVHCSRRLRAVLADLNPAHAAFAAGTLVFPDAAGSDGLLRWRYRHAFKRAAARVAQRDLRIHDLRHLAAINLVRAGVDLPTIQAHLGHRHLISTLRYAAYADDTASARAARALDTIHDRHTPPGP